MFKGDFEAKGLVVVRVEGVLLDCRLLLLQPLAVLHQVDLHIRICGETNGAVKSLFCPSTEATEHGVTTLTFHRFIKDLMGSSAQTVHLHTKRADIKNVL